MARAERSEDRLPIKIVVPQEQDFVRLPTGGSARKVFCSVDRALRDDFLNQVSALRHHFRDYIIRDGLPVVARVV